MFKRIIKSYDYSLIIVYFLLCLFGLIMIYSASMVTAIQIYGKESDFFYDKQKQHLIVSFVTFAIMAFLPYKLWGSKQLSKILVFGSFLVLILVLFFGHVSNNAQSWFTFGSRSIQPAEFVKLVVIIYLSSVYARKQSYINEFNVGVIPPIVFLVGLCFFVALQPDLGTAAIIFAIGCTIIICSGMNMKNIMRLAVLSLVFLLFFSPFIYMKKDDIITKERIGRINGFLKPFEYEQDDGYHLVNSYLAIGSGGVKGQGIGQSIQKLGYLPEPHTDFIMAIIAEELGVFGVLFVLFGLAYIVLKGIYIAVRCKDPFGTLLAIGISSMIAIQSFINLGGVSGLIPITGVPLPFISYGGSSLLLLSLSMGILVNISMFVRYEQKYKKKSTTTTKGITTFS
ncbi:MAG: FtsW/RodA/SpoVE family cell cycle protein [Bacillus sp. (in: Bacteria)]|jgi:cell division protein FtsW|nr:FtsW/RodA/SpoVE family cell cycle protein [Bacillus sp. (in: firmicutes)]